MNASTKEGELVGDAVSVHLASVLGNTPKIRRLALRSHLQRLSQRPSSNEWPKHEY
jgi:hypothetical protein